MDGGGRGKVEGENVMERKERRKEKGEEGKEEGEL